MGTTMAWTSVWDTIKQTTATVGTQNAAQGIPPHMMLAAELMMRSAERRNLKRPQAWTPEGQQRLHCTQSHNSTAQEALPPVYGR